MNRKERLLPNGVPRWVRVYDNGGETIDRYTVVFTGNYTNKTKYDRNRWHNYLGMSHDPFCPQGFCIHESQPYQIDAPNGAWPPAVGRKNHLGKRITFQDLSSDCQKVVLSDYKELWDL